MRIHHRKPFREPDWRHLRCQDLIKGNSRPCHRRDDPATWSAWRYFHALSRCGNDEQRERVRRCRPDIAAAVGLFDGGDPFRRWELEARLLTHELIGTIAKRFGLTAETVEAYTSLFFDIRDCLDATDYITLRVVGFSPARSHTEKDVETWLKLFGYHGGPHVLDEVIEYFQDPEPIPEDVNSVGHSRLARLKRHLQVRSSILARCIPNDARLIQLDLLFNHLEAQRGGSQVATQFPGRLRPDKVEDLVKLLGGRR